MTKENNKVDINKHEMDIGTLKKQNVNDLLSIKELYSKLEELGEKITQVKYIDNTLIKKIKKEYGNLKKIILDENIQLQLDNKIEEFNLKLTHDIETINSQLTDVIKTINSQIGSIENKFTVVNAKDFGAKGDGVTDDTQSLQNALDYLNSIGGGTLFLPAGSYIISKNYEALTLDNYGSPNIVLNACLIIRGNNITIIGEGKDNTNLKMYPSNYKTTGNIDGELSTMIILSSSVYEDGEKPAKQYNISIKNLELNGGAGQWNSSILANDSVPKKPQQGKGIHCYSYSPIENFTVENCNIINMYQEGIYGQRSKNGKVINCYFDYCNPAGGNLCGSTTYDGCTFKNNHNFNIEHAHDGEFNKLIVRNCYFYDCVTAPICHIGSYYTKKDDNIQSIFISDNNNFIYSDNNKYSKNINIDNYDVAIIENNIINTLQSEKYGYYGITLKNIKKSTLKNNTIYLNNTSSGTILNFDNTTLNKPIYEIKSNNFIINNESITNNLATNRLQNGNALGVFPLLDVRNNSYISNFNTSSISLTNGNKTAILTNRIKINKYEKYNFSIYADLDTELKIEIVELSGYGGDGINRIISDTFSAIANTTYNFTLSFPYRTNKSLITSDTQIYVTSNKDCNINFSIG